MSGKVGGTTLKPSFEPIIVARKPFKGSLVDNVIEYGVGGINIDECRVENTNNEKLTRNLYDNPSWKNSSKAGQGSVNDIADKLGRFPANTILTYDETDKEEVCGGMPIENNQSASRYFYCAKTSKKDRDEGLWNFESVKLNLKENGGDRNKDDKHIYKKTSVMGKNLHPCVKPCELMAYLVRLVTPKEGTILDPFMGSGSTGKAVMFENRERNANYKFIGIEKDKKIL